MRCDIHNSQNAPYTYPVNCVLCCTYIGLGTWLQRRIHKMLGVAVLSKVGI